MASRSGCAMLACSSIAFSTICQILGNPTRRSKNAATAISLAAFITAGNVPPVSPARRARFKAGKSSYRGVENSYFVSFVKSSGGNVVGTPTGHGTAYLIGEDIFEVPNLPQAEPV